MKKAVLVGMGGMGQRYIKSLKLLKIKIIAVCDNDKIRLKSIKEKDIVKTTNHIDLLRIKADILCISSNTFSREKILKDFLLVSPIKNILTEKPFATSFSKSLYLSKLISSKKNKRVLVNTFRTISNNYKKIDKIFNKKEPITHISIISPSAGLGNMGSIFFDICNYFLKSKCESLSCQIDKTNTPSPRGKIFKDPGAYGVIKFSKNKKVFFDLSENTSLPYQIILKSKNLELSIDEINNKYILRSKPKKFLNKPNYFYLFKPDIYILKKMEKYDVVKLTTYSIKKLFQKNFISNVKSSLKSMELVFACHASKKIENNIKLPLPKKFHKLKINFP
jgi:hypothetical protein